MTAMSGDQVRQTYIAPPSTERNFPNIAANVTIYDGAMVAIDSSGNCRPARPTASDRVLGPSTKRVPSQAGAGVTADGKGVDVDPGRIQRYANSSAGDAITVADIDRDCYVVDDATVARTSAGNSRPRAGRIAKVDSSGVWVDFLAQPTTKVTVGPLRITDVSTASDSAKGYAPIAGRVIKVWGVLGAAITVADSIVTPKINGVAVTGTLTVPVAGSGVDVESFMHPTNNYTVALGDVLLASTGGESTTTATYDVFFEIESI